MAKTRVSVLAKEYGMTSKEMLGHLKDMKIPATSPSSSLEDAYVNMVKKKLAPILEARAAEIEAAKQAEAEKKAAEEAEAKAKAEEERIAAEKRREAERAEEEKRRAAEEERRAKQRAEEEKRREAERLAAEEAERNRVKDTAPKAVPSMASLLNQIAQQEKVLAQQAAEAASAKAEAKSGNSRGGHNASGRGRRQQPGSQAMDVAGEQARAEGAGSKRGKGHKARRGEESSEDRYSRMARAAEEYNREHVLEEARAAVEEASRESTGRRKKRKERRQKQAEEAAEQQRIEEAIANDQDLSQLDTVKVPQGSTVAELAELLGVPANDIIKRLFLLGNPLTLTQSMSDDLIELVADDLGREVKVMSKEEENSFTFYDDPADLLPRAPVVTVMGHVDHGKTSLLDAIRHTGVAEGEAGGITQAIGASQVKINDRIITFIDTPGHETFTAMRARGAKVTDIVILIVAADDGVMPQTIESINHAKAAGVPIIVAVNKIDKPGANPDKVRQELTEYGVIPEEWGGQNMFVNISAKKKIGIDDLLETVLLQADVLELKGNPNTFASGNVLEAKLDKGRGSVATVLVTRGTLHVGDTIVAGTAYGRVRAMQDDKGARVLEAGPSDPVEVVGFSDVPEAGDNLYAVEEGSFSRQVAEERRDRQKAEQIKAMSKVSLDDLFSQIEQGNVKELNVIVKADVQGSVEAVRASLEKISNAEVRVRAIHGGVGAITPTDVMLASASNAIIVGFNVRPQPQAKEAAEQEKVDIRLYRVIYQAIEDIENAIHGMLAPVFKEVVLGHVDVREVYRVSKVGTIAGGYVTDGKVTRNASVRLIRDGVVVHEGEIASLRRFKDDVREVASGYECGISLVNYNDIKQGDQLEAFTNEQVEA